MGTTTVTVSGGIATFTNLQDNQPERIILLFTAPTLAKAQSTPITVSPAAPSGHFITAPSTATAGTAFNITVTAFDPYDNVATGYRGAIRFTSSDSRAPLPSVHTFTSGNRGVPMQPPTVAVVRPRATAQAVARRDGVLAKLGTIRVVF